MKVVTQRMVHNAQAHAKKSARNELKKKRHQQSAVSSQKEKNKMYLHFSKSYTSIPLLDSETLHSVKNVLHAKIMHTIHTKWQQKRLQSTRIKWKCKKKKLKYVIIISTTCIYHSTIYLLQGYVKCCVAFVVRYHVADVHDKRVGKQSKTATQHTTYILWLSLSTWISF